MLPKDLYSKWDSMDNLDKKTGTQNEAVQEPEVAQTEQKSISAIRPMGDDLKVTIRIGDVNYRTDISKILYLESFVRLQKATRPETTEIIHGPINLFDVALKGVESGYRQCFRCLPPNLSQYRALLQTYKFLDVDVLNNLSMDQVIANLKVIKKYDDFEERRQISRNKAFARDTAFQLLYLMLQPRSGDETMDSMKLFNAVIFVVSHPGTFKDRTKRMVRVAYEEQFRLTFKQRVRLDQWEKGETADSEVDMTTEEESDFDFDSDNSLSSF